MPQKLPGLITTILLTLFSWAAFGQTIIVPNMVSLAQDTMLKNELVSSLNNFLSLKEGPNENNKYVLNEDLLATFALLDEMRGIEQSNRYNDKNFYKCHLTNVVKLEGNSYMVQFSYMGISDGIPVLRGSFRMIAKNINGQFYFASPLKQNTGDWKATRLGNVVFYYKNVLDRKDAESYFKIVNFYDRKLKNPVLPVYFYECGNFTEALQLLGVDYKSDHNGIITSNLDATENGATLFLSGGRSSGYRFDPHDLWHERLRIAMNGDIINRPVDEGCAYLYGGSWGFTWMEVLAKFKQYANANPQADWLTLYTGSAKFETDEKPLYIAYALNALIAQKIEKEKEFAVVKELLGCGKRETDDENYFKALEKVSGISKVNFNKAMWELIKAVK